MDRILKKIVKLPQNDHIIWFIYFQFKDRILSAMLIYFTYEKHFFTFFSKYWNASILSLPWSRENSMENIIVYFQYLEKKSSFSFWQFSTFFIPLHTILGVWWYFGIDSLPSPLIGRWILIFDIETLSFSVFGKGFWPFHINVLSFPLFGRSVFAFQKFSVSFIEFGPSILTFPKLSLWFPLFGSSILTLTSQFKTYSTLMFHLLWQDWLYFKSFRVCKTFIRM